jgi:hypothetical protein
MSYGIFAGFDWKSLARRRASNKWHQSVGGGIWLNGLGTLTTRLTYFKSADDEGRVTLV